MRPACCSLARPCWPSPRRVGPRARPAAYLLFLAVCVDLAITNAGLNLTSEVAKLTPPRWYPRLSSAERLYIGGRVRGFMNTADRDAAQSWKVPAENTAMEGRMELNAELPMAPSGWRVREALSYDLPVLWPSEYEAIVRAFEHAGREQRKRSCGAAACDGVLLPSPSEKPLAEVAHWEGMKLVECDPSATRVFVTTTGRIGADPNWQRAALFDTVSGDSDCAWRGCRTLQESAAPQSRQTHGSSRTAPMMSRSKPRCRPKASSCFGTRSTRPGARRSMEHQHRWSARMACIARSESRLVVT